MLTCKSPANNVGLRVPSSAAVDSAASGFLAGETQGRKGRVPKTKSPQLSAADAKAILRTAKMRGTAARIAVVQCLARERFPLTHAEVTERLSEFGFDQSTIYRCLIELADNGLLARLDLGDSLRRFELLRDEHAGVIEHPHFLCIDCGKIQCLADFKFSLSPRRGAANPGKVTEVLVKGHCSSCGER
jgi:Fur family ferric uptake transcriptional regulator